MEKIKKLQLPLMLVVAFLLVFLVRGTASAAEVQTIVPTVGGAESASVYQYEVSAKAGGTLTVVPVQIANAGLVCLEISVLADQIDIMLVLSQSPNSVEGDNLLNFSIGCLHTTLHYYAEEPCTRYLMFFTKEEQALSVTVKAYQDTVTVTSDGQLQNKKWADGYAYTEKDAFFRVNVGSSGCFKVEIEPEDAQQKISVNLLNGKKKEISSDATSYEKITYYGVKKGTYYFKVSTTGKFRIRSTFETVKEKNNTSKAKAVVLKRGKTEKGLFRLGDKKIERYYKVNLTKDQTVKISIPSKGHLDEQFFLVIYQLKGKKLQAVKITGGLKKKGNVKLKLKKGTYYFVVEGCGYTGSYTIQWK